MSRMAQIMDSKGVTKLTDDEFQDVLHFYFTFSPETQPALPADPDLLESSVRFELSVLGNAANADSRDHPFLGRVQTADLGVHWLENKGNLNFVSHDIYRCYRAYCAVTAELDNDIDFDIVVTTLF